MRKIMPKPEQPALVTPADVLPAPAQADAKTASNSGQAPAPDVLPDTTLPKPKRRGRAATMLTSDEGITQDAWVGRKLLLGQ